ncbi:hypothetical protein LCGC14_2313440 [marine sediment metagenome]|uniref:HEPN domain-containing protein n=1 Tax=marine sediment metagenome TaxID=412755 RepID=A0A0F9D7I5_9ZZZZ
MLITTIYLMKSTNPKYVAARKMLVQDAIDELTQVQNFSNFYQRSFYQIAKYGLQLKARGEKLFASDNWSYPQCKDELIEKIRKFLEKHLK